MELYPVLYFYCSKCLQVRNTVLFIYKRMFDRRKKFGLGSGLCPSQGLQLGCLWSPCEDATVGPFGSSCFMKC